MATDSEECCGSGCNNCILDQQLKQPDSKTRINLFAHNYQSFRLTQIEKEMRFTYKFSFELVCNRPEPYQHDEQLDAPPVSFLMLRAPRIPDLKPFNPAFDDFKTFLHSQSSNDNDELFKESQQQRHDKETPEIYMSRKYTPYEINKELRTFKIIVKLEKFGKMSTYFTQLAVGSICEFKGPFEAFNYIHDEFENYIVITQGISVVSAFRLVKEIICENAQSRILVISCFKNLNEMILREDFFQLSHFWCLKHHIFLSEEVDPVILPRSGENIHSERLNDDNFKKLMKELKFFVPNKTQILVSGRDSFIDSIRLIVAKCSFANVASI